MDKIKELWDKLVAWAQTNPVVAGIGGIVLLFGLFWAWKKMKRRTMMRRAARRARRALKKKRSRR